MAIHSEFDVLIPPETLFENSVLAEQAAILDASRGVVFR
jgi:hypothetical protein